MNLVVRGRKFKVEFSLSRDQNIYLNAFTGKAVYRDVTSVVVTEINSAGKTARSYWGEAIRKPSDIPNKEMGRLQALWQALEGLYGRDARVEYSDFLTEYAARKIGNKSFFRTYVDFAVQVSKPMQVEK